MANSCLTFTFNICSMLNIISKLKMPLKMSSLLYLLANIDTQQIQNNLTAILYKIMIWQPNQNHLNWDQTCPTDKVQTGGEGLHYFHTLCPFAQMKFWHFETQVWCASFTWRINENNYWYECTKLVTPKARSRTTKINVHLQNTDKLSKYARTTKYKNNFNGKKT